MSLVDPPSAALRSMPHNLGEWQTTAAASRVVGLDNISRIKEEMSDAMCRATTGEGAAKRQLYTDEDLIVQSYRRALLLTSIDPGALKGDLGERLMPVELLKPSIPRGEEELDAVLARHRPRILGALLDLVAEVLANPPTTLEQIGRGLQEELEFGDELLDLCEWIIDRHADRTWDYDSADLRRAGVQLVAMVARSSMTAPRSSAGSRRGRRNGARREGRTARRGDAAVRARPRARDSRAPSGRGSAAGHRRRLGSLALRR